MSDIDLAIARHFEAIPPKRPEFVGNKSAKGFWEGTTKDGRKYEWKAVSHREPEVAMKLLTALIKDHVLTLMKAPNGEVFYVGFGVPIEPQGSLEDAIALAFARANNLEVK